LRRLPAEVMVRNRRATTGVALTRRVARTLVVQPSPAERELYAGLSELLRERCRTGAISRMMLQTLQMELGSGPHAAASTLERLLGEQRREPAMRDGLRGFLDQARKIDGDAKSRALLELARGWPDKLLVFTRYRAT